jgi:hypothetical protein
MPARTHQDLQPCCPAHVRASSPAGPNAHNTPKRRAQTDSHLGPLLLALLAHIGRVGQLLLLLVLLLLVWCVNGQVVDDRNVGNGDAVWQGSKNVPPSLGTGTGAVAALPAPLMSPGRWQRVGSWEQALPARCTTRRKVPFRMLLGIVVCAARDGYCISVVNHERSARGCTVCSWTSSQGQSHIGQKKSLRLGFVWKWSVSVWRRAMHGHAAVALDGRGIGWQHADAEAVAEAGTAFPTLELKSPGEGERVEPD